MKGFYHFLNFFKMKRATFLLILFFSVFVFSVTSFAQNVFLESKSNAQYNLDEKNELTKLVPLLAAENRHIELVEANFEQLNDKNGKFDAISAKYKSGKKYVRLVVPLTLNGKFYTIGECTMKVASILSFDDCTQTIIERCKTQRFTNHIQDRGSSATISFVSDK